MMPRLLMHTSLSTGGRLSSSKVGIVVLMVRIAMPTRPICTKALQRKRPMPGGLMAKLHSLVDSNSAACLSFITLRTISIVCWGLNCVLDTGAILPSIFSAGGKPAVMNRSEPFCFTSRASSSWMNLVAVSRSMVRAPILSSTAEEVLVDRAIPRFGLRHLVSADHFYQALVEGLHSGCLAGLDRRIHLGNLVFANEVPDRRGADHDFVCRDAPLLVLGLEQCLGNGGYQRLGQHRAHHILLRGRKHVDDAVVRLGRRARMQRSEHQVARFRRGQRQPDRLQVAHFAHEYVIGVFAQ